MLKYTYYDILDLKNIINIFTEFADLKKKKDLIKLSVIFLLPISAYKKYDLKNQDKNTTLIHFTTTYAGF